MTGQRGFTLLELLVALAVLGFILAGIAGGVQFGQRAGAIQARSIAEHADIGAADRVLRRLVASMDAGTSTELPNMTANATSLAFTGDLGDAAAALGTGTADIGLGVNGMRRLVLRWTPSLHAVRLGPAPPPAEAVLLDGVERVEFAYWGRGPGGGQWLSAWPGPDIPALIRIRLQLAQTRRTWPDIIVATRQQRSR